MMTPLFICICTLLLLALHVSNIQGYTVSGTKIINPDGDEVIIRGMCRPSLEWSNVGEHLSLADYTLMKGWGANAVRISVNQDTWLSSSLGAAYKTLISQQIQWIRSLGMGVLVDLHWNNGAQQYMADQNSITFWRSFAQAYANNPWVIFELYNEPHDVSWSVWLNGDSTWAGMQELYNAVREVADNMVIVNGLNWAFDLSSINSYSVVGTNIAYGAHPYDYPGKGSSAWDAAFGFLTSRAPVILTEFGQYCNTGTYVADLLAYCKQKGIHWTAWAWYVNGCSFPSIIADWSGTPNGAVGTVVYNYLKSGGPSSSGSQTISSSGGSNSGTVTPASNPLTVYTDSLQNGFQDWSWSTDKNFQDSTNKHGGSYSIKFAVQKDEALYFHSQTAITLGSYSSLQFWALGASSLSAGILKVLLYDNSGEPAAIGTAQTFPAVGTSWTLVSISLSSFGLASTTQITGFAVQATTAGSAGYAWLDDISFVPPASGTTTTTGKAPTTTTTTSRPTTTTTTTTTSRPTTTTTTSRPTTTTTTTTARPSTSTATTARPTTTTTTTARPSTSTSTTARASTSTSTSTTARASTSTTRAPTTTTTRSATTGSSSSTCDASSIVFTHTAGNTWQADGVTITAYAVTISTTCTTRTALSLSFSVSNWNPLSSWGLTVSGGIATLPSYVAVSASSPYTGIGYQNAGVAGFTVKSVAWQ